MKFTKFRYLTFSFLLTFTLINCNNKSSIKVIKLAHALDTNHPVHKGMVFMAERLFEKSNGSMRIDIYPASQLGSERELIELLQIGILGITKVSSATLENFVPSARIYSIPYIFTDNDHRWNILKGDVGRKVLLDCEKFWFCKKRT